MASTDTRPESDLGPRPDGRTVAERRRPGRVADTSPALIALLRRSGAAPTAPAPERTDDLGAARGIGGAVAVGVVVWAVILLAIRALWPA